MQGILSGPPLSEVIVMYLKNFYHATIQPFRERHVFISRSMIDKNRTDSQTTISNINWLPKRIRKFQSYLTNADF